MKQQFTIHEIPEINICIYLTTELCFHKMCHKAEATKLLHVVMRNSNRLQA